MTTATALCAVAETPADGDSVPEAPVAVDGGEEPAHADGEAEQEGQEDEGELLASDAGDDIVITSSAD